MALSRPMEITPSADDDLDEQNGGFEIPAKRARSVLQGEQPRPNATPFSSLFLPLSFPSEQKLVPYAKRTDDHREISNKNPPPDSTNLSNLRRGGSKGQLSLRIRREIPARKGRKREIRKGRSLPRRRRRKRVER